MFKLKCTVVSFSRHCNFKRYLCIAAEKEVTSKWDLLSAVCLERKPLIARELNDIESRFASYLARMELDKSHKSDHEIRHETDLKHAEMLKKGEVDVDADQAAKQTALDFEDICKEELNKFAFSPRDMYSNEDSDFHSVKRKADRNLMFVVEQKLGNNLVWVLPQGKRENAEALHETAQRVLADCCGNDLKVRFYGYAPCGFYKYKYPNKIRQNLTDSVGAKVFFFKAQYLSGNLSLNNGMKDFRWLGRNELPQHFHKDYFKTVMKFVLDED